MLKKIFLTTIFFFFFNIYMAYSLEIGLATLSKSGNIPKPDEINSLENKLGQKIDTINWFMGFNYDTHELPEIPLKEMLTVFKPNSIVPMLTIEPWGRTRSESGRPTSPFDPINKGLLDSYFQKMAKDLKTYGAKVRFRFAHEMIQNDVPESIDPHPGWYPWQDFPDQYVSAFRRIHDIFVKAYANNVEFVWAPNFHVHDFNIIRKYYPGSKYVDWIGLDGYNWSGESFDGLFERIYSVFNNHIDFFGLKPIMISEIGMAENLDRHHRSKASWIEDAFIQLRKNYERIQAVYWFQVNKENDWRFDTTPQSFQAFKSAISRK